MSIGIRITSRCAAIMFIAVVLVAAASSRATAHHSFAAFDVQTQKTVTGTVKQVEWTNPHIWIWLDVPNSKGGVDVFGFEGMSPNYLSRRNWTKGTLKPGDKITIDYRPLRDGKNGGMFMTGKLTSGTVLSMQGGPPDR
jgi:hypothetical protein